jgi:hypothetical protein
VRPSVTTHSSNSEQRLVDVPFTGSGSIQLILPENPRLAPPGWYMVFAVDGSGVPSVGQWLRLETPTG